MSNQVEQTADRVRSEDDPYLRGYMEGKKFAEERATHLWELDEETNTEYLYCKIKRSVWRKANTVWQVEQASPQTYMSPQGILEWIVCRVPEMKFRNTWAEGEGYLKAFLERRGLKVKTGEL